MKLRSRPPLRAAVVFALATALGSCAFVGKMTGGSAEGEEAGQAIEIRLSLDKSVYRPGEMAVCRAQVRNLLDKDVVVVEPSAHREKDYSTINFWVVVKDGADVTRRVPVLPEVPPPPRPVAIPAGDSPTTRSFSFVNLTRLPGPYILQAHYKTKMLSEDGEREVIVSPPVEFRVEGERLLRRDRDDILLKEEAIRVARSKYGKVAKAAEALLQRNEVGLLDWWVTLTKMPYDVAPGESARVAYYVSPYGGFVRAEAKPFEEEPGGAKAGH